MASGQVQASADESVRTRLLEAATGLFARKGYAATTVREIVDAAGVTKPVLYYYFGSKEGIFLALMTEGLGQYGACIHAALAEGGTVSERVLRLFDRVFALLLEHLDVARVIHSIYYGPPQGAPPFDYEAFHRTFDETLLGLVTEAMASGEFAAGNPQDVAWALVGAFSVAEGVSLCHLDIDMNREGLSRILRVVLHGVLSDGFRQKERAQ